MHSDFMLSITAVILMFITAPVFFPLISTLAMVIYFGSMTKMNIVDKKYDGRWGKYWRSYLRYFKKKQK